MATKPYIRRFKSLKKLGVFHDYSAKADVPEFHQFNLIYGFNGTGKTTLSRILASLEAGLLRTELPPDGEFEVELSNEEVIKATVKLNALKGRLLVFNVDFVESNLRWKDGAANPIFYLGVEQAKLSQRLEALETSIVEKTAKATEATSLHASATRMFAGYKRDRARQIEQQIGLARQYDASNLTADYADQTFDGTHILDQKLVKQQIAIISQDAPLPKLALIGTSLLDISNWIKTNKTLLESKIGSLILSDLQRHESMLRWVKDGYDYHLEHELASCLFCGNFIPEERLSSLANILDSKFDALITSITSAQEKGQRLNDQLVAIRSAVPSKNDLAKEHSFQFIVDSSALNLAISQTLTIISSTLDLLKQKALTPNLQIDIHSLPTDVTLIENENLINKQLAKINKIIEAHNISCDSFNQVQEKARKKLKSHYLAEGEVRYRELERAFDSTKSQSEKLNGELDSLSTQAAEIRHSIRKHGPAADRINRLIKSYLGHAEIQIEAQEDGYQIQRGGKIFRGLLSEGEKTAIALCYFLSTLSAEGRKLKDLIIVIDDPISSLDTRALNFAFNLIKGAVFEAGQFIILTHNINFMNEVKKWLKNRARDGKASLLFLEAMQTQINVERECRIIELPKLLRDYDSEYQYLFSIVLAFANSAVQYPENFYLIPNALRKVLDIYLAFKVPGASGLAEKLNHPVIRNCGMSHERICALDRLAQIESHADSLDDLVSFSSMTVEETRDAATALFELMAETDESHYKQLKSICS